MGRASVASLLGHCCPARESVARPGMWRRRLHGAEKRAARRRAGIHFSNSQTRDACPSPLLRIQGGRGPVSHDSDSVYGPPRWSPRRESARRTGSRQANPPSAVLSTAPALPNTRPSPFRVDQAPPLRAIISAPADQSHRTLERVGCLALSVAGQEMKYEHVHSAKGFAERSPREIEEGRMILWLNPSIGKRNSLVSQKHWNRLRARQSGRSVLTVQWSVICA